MLFASQSFICCWVVKIISIIYIIFLKLITLFLGSLSREIIISRCQKWLSSLMNLVHFLINMILNRWSGRLFLWGWTMLYWSLLNSWWLYAQLVVFKGIGILSWNLHPVIVIFELYKLLTSLLCFHLFRPSLLHALRYSYCEVPFIRDGNLLQINCFTFY